MRLITDTENLFEQKKMKLEGINLELRKDAYLLTNFNSSEQIEEEQEETLANLSNEKKAKKGRILSLEILTSSYLTKSTIIKLTSQGYAQGARKIRDGITYFGFEDPDKCDPNNVSVI